jgi:hypothetical protein
MPEPKDEIDELLANTVTESSRLSDEYFVMPGYGRYELFGCHRSLESREGQRLRPLVIRLADEVGVDRGLLAVSAVSEQARISRYLSLREVESPAVGLDYWVSLQYTVSNSGLPGVTRIRSRRIHTRDFENEQHNVLPRYAFPDGPTALLAFAALLKVYDNRILRAGGSALRKVTRLALVRYAYNHSPNDALVLAQKAASGTEVLAVDGPAGKHHPLRSATIHAVQAFAVSEDFFQ